MSKYNFHLPNKPATKSGSILSYDYSDNRTFIPQPLTFSRGSNATYIDKDGLIKSTTGDLPRVNVQDGSLLLEQQSGNIALNSSDLTNNSWTKWNSSASSSNIINPEGNTGASVYTCSNYGGSNQFFRINPNIAYATSTYTYSMFVKYNTFQFCKLAYTRYNFNHFAAIFDIINGTITATDTNGDVQNTSSNIEDFGNGWFRISITAAIGGTYDGNFEFNKSPSATPTFTHFGRTSQTTTTNDKAYIWGLQLEQKSFPTSYIPTTNTTVTRLAETAINAGTENVFNSEEGVLYAEIAALANSGTFRQIAITDVTTNNSLDVYYRTTDNQITFRLKSSGTQYIFENFTIDNVLNFNKIAFKYKSGESKVFINGSLKQTYTNATMPLNLSKLNFVQNGNPFYGKVKELKVFNKALTDTELQQLTTQ